VAAALWIAACGPPGGDEQVPADGEKTGPVSMDSAAAHGRWSLRVRRGRDGRVVVQNGPVPMLPRGAVAAVPRWRMRSPGPRMVAGSGRLFVFDLRPRGLYVVPLPADSAPRLSPQPYPFGTQAAQAVSRGLLAAVRGTSYMHSELIVQPPGGGRETRTPVDGLVMQVQGVDSGFVVNTQLEGRTAFRLVRFDGSVRRLGLPKPPYTRRFEQVRWVALANDGSLVMASPHWPGFRSVTLDGRVVRDVLTDPPEAPPLPEWNDEPYGWINTLCYDRATGLYALAETIRITTGKPVDTALHLFTPEGVFLATLRVPGTMREFELSGGRVYALVDENDDETTLQAFDLRIPPGALDSARAAFRRAGGAP